MKIAPMVRNNIFLNAHPEGCAAEVRLQIAQAASLKAKIDAARPSKQRLPRNVLVIGASTGYGLASRIVAGFAYGAATVGFSYEKEPGASKTASPGWYANRSFDQEAAKSGLFAKTFNIDAFSHEAKNLAIATARAGDFAYDLVIYSLASPVRVDPDTGTMYRSVIKPIGRDYAGKTADVFSGKISEAHVQPAEEKEIEETVKVMGGEDWILWLEALDSAKVLDKNAITVAYSYIGPPLSWPIYRDGTIGRAKAHLERSARDIRAEHEASGLQAFVSINKAVVTRASAVIPIIPLYVSTLFKVMKERNIHEDCMDQMKRLFMERLYMREGSTVPVDAEGRIRLDELEMGAAVQEDVSVRLGKINEANLDELTDIEGFRRDFLQAHGFDVPGVDYEADVDPLR
ncbi:MAG TPA: enoyl-ACP reductase FabV [Rectinemataceae bacterium]|nr:enoyl-ACP reductase FabV [Rectinemataceae bacterium]